MDGFTVRQRAALASLLFAAVSLISCAATVLALAGCRPLVVRGQAAVAASTEKPLTAAIDMLTPGAPVQIGAGGGATACVAGWVLTFRGQLQGKFGLITAGHCAKGDHQAPVFVQYVERGKSAVVNGTKQVQIGHVVAVPTGAAAPDLAIIWITASWADFGGVNAKPGGNVLMGDLDVVDDQRLIDGQSGATRICFSYDSTRPDVSARRSACGTASEVADGTLLVNPPAGFAYKPEIDGAPAWAVEQGGNRPVGVITGQRDGKLVVANMFDTLEKVLADDCRQMNEDATTCQGSHS